MLVKAEGEFKRNFTTINHHSGRSRLIFYGDSVRAVRTWLNKYPTQKIAYKGRVYAYRGTYQKSSYGKSEVHDALSIRHAGWGKGTIGVPGVSYGAKRGLVATGVVVTRGFIGLLHEDSMHSNNPASASPKFMHHQKSVSYLATFDAGGGWNTGAVTFAALRSA